MLIICLGFGVVVFVCGERKWLAYVAKARPSVLRILAVCVCLCVNVHAVMVRALHVDMVLRVSRWCLGEE